MLQTGYVNPKANVNGISIKNNMATCPLVGETQICQYGRRGTVLFLLSLHFYLFSSLSPVPPFHLLYSLLPASFNWILCNKEVKLQQGKQLLCQDV